MQKPDETNEELKAEKNEIKDLEQDYDLGINLNNSSTRSHDDKPEEAFSLYIFDQINALRENPQSFIEEFEKAKCHIALDKIGVKVYKSSVKVALNKGEEAFDKAIEVLEKMESMKNFKYNPDFLIELPTNELDSKSKEYLTDQVKLQLDEEIKFKSFWKDIVRDAESCFILTIVDDSGKNVGNKRNDILNTEITYIGITIVRIIKSFTCYFIIG